jgi:hypothetical protein
LVAATGSPAARAASALVTYFLACEACAMVRRSSYRRRSEAIPSAVLGTADEADVRALGGELEPDALRPASRRRARASRRTAGSGLRRAAETLVEGPGTTAWAAAEVAAACAS